MARPKNTHHVHSDGYFSEMGEADTERMLEELSDEIEQIPDVQHVRPESDRLEVEYDGRSSVRDDVADVVADWGCSITDDSDGWLVIRP